MAKVALLLKVRSLSDKLVLTGNIVTNMTGNPLFTTPNPPLADLTSAKTDVNALLMEIVDLESALAMKRIQLGDRESILDNFLAQLASYAENITTDAAALESGGFPLARDPQPIGMLPAPSNLLVVPGQLGTCDLRWSRDRGTKTFLGQCATAPEGPWTTIYNGTRARCTATALVSGQQYWFRVAAIGAAGQSDWSNPVPKRAA